MTLWSYLRKQNSCSVRQNQISRRKPRRPAPRGRPTSPSPAALRSPDRCAAPAPRGPSRPAPQPRARADPDAEGLERCGHDRPLHFERRSVGPSDSDAMGSITSFTFTFTSSSFIGAGDGLLRGAGTSSSGSAPGSSSFCASPSVTTRSSSSLASSLVRSAVEAGAARLELDVPGALADDGLHLRVTAERDRLARQRRPRPFARRSFRYEGSITDDAGSKSESGCGGLASARRCRNPETTHGE